MTDDKQEWNGGCHCGSVRFRVRLSGGLGTARRCTCSMCRRRGAIAVSAELDGLRILSGEDSLSCYQFNTMTAKHYFCSRCGIYTHHQRRSDPRQFGVNAACLDGLSPFDFAAVPVLDGVRHPSDHPGRGDGVVGILRFDPSR